MNIPQLEPKYTFELDFLTIAGFVVLAIIMVMATLGGVGGGATLLPIGLVFFRMTLPESIAITSLYTFVSIVARLVYDLITTYSDIKKRKINFHLSIISAPMMCLGSFIGVKFNKLAPSVAVLSGMTIILSWMFYLLVLEYKKRIKLELEKKQKQKQLFEAQQKASGEKRDTEVSLSIEKEPESQPSAKQDSKFNLTQKSDNQAKEVINEDNYKKMEDTEKNSGGLRSYEQVTLKRSDFVILFLILLTNPALSFGLRALEKHSPKEEEKCNPDEFVMMSGYLGVIVLLTIISSLLLKKRNIGIKSSDTQVELSTSAVWKMLLGSFAISLFGSGFSLSISTLFSIYLFKVGVSPFVASPTSMFLSFLCYTSSTLLYILDGRIEFYSGLIGSIVIAITTITTRIKIYQSVMDKGKASVLMLCMVILIGITIPINVWQVLPKVIKDFNAGKKIWEFEKLC